MTGTQIPDSVAAPWGVSAQGCVDQTLAARLLDQQMWCFGQDIRNPSGNLLVRFGFTPHRCPGKTPGSTAYCLNPSTDRPIVLWGFGMFYGERPHGGMFLRRYQFLPAWTPISALSAMVWEPHDLPEMRMATPGNEAAQLRCLLKSACLWLADFEEWILETMGADYRHCCLSAWHNKPVAAQGLPDVWRELARQYLVDSPS